MLSSISLGLRGRHYGQALAGWLNRYTRDHLAILMSIFLGMERGAQAGGETLAEKWERLWKRLEPYHTGNPAIPRNQRPLVLNSSEWNCQFAMVIRPRGGKLAFEVDPADETSEALVSLAMLMQIGLADRVRLCPNCERFFFALRADSTLCSQPCRESACRKTPAGRKARAEYMRRFRMEQRERERKQNLTGKHLKVSKGTLDKIGK